MAMGDGEEDQEICRVCRSEGTLEEPLFYPCRCTGSIRYVHADCLEEWLKHSKKETCELCKARFRFTKLYEPDMPKRIPKWLLLKKLVLHSVLVVRFSLRLLLAAYVWLGVVPTIVYWHWTGIWFHGSWVAHGLYGGRQRFYEHDSTSDTVRTYDAPRRTKLSLFSLSEPLKSLAFPLWGPPALILKKFVNIATVQSELTANKGTLRQLAATAGKGQLVIIFVAVTFLIFILLRDWVSHNVPQDVLWDMADQAPPLVEEPPAPIEEARPLSQVVENAQRDVTNSEQTAVQTRADASSSSVSVPTLQPLAEPPAAPADPPARPAPRRDWSSWYNAAVHTTQSTNDQDDDARDTPQAGSSADEQDTPLQRIRGISEESREDRGALADAQSPDEAHVDDQIAAVAAAAAAAEAVAAEEAEDEDDDGVEELFDTTLESVLEIVGIEGSLLSLFRNAALLTIAIAFCLSLQIWAPFVLGKTLMLASPPAVFRLPVQCCKAIAGFLLSAVTRISGRSQLPAVLSRLMTLVRRISGGISLSDTQIGRVLANQMSPWLGKVAALAHILEKRPDLPDTIFTLSLRQARLSALAAAIERWNLMSRTDTVASRIVAILTGVSAGTLIAIFAAEQIPARSGRMMDSVRSSLKEYKIATKVALFISIELIIFPLFCGVLLDVATLPLLPAGTGAARISQFLRYPISAAYLHWFFGTAFMFSFAMFVAACREIVRSGVFYWIRDPGDPTFHPVKEIVERSTLSQLHKLLSSAAMYGTIIVVGMGVVFWLQSRLCADLLPIRLPDSSSHGDNLNFLLLNQVLPITLHWLRPRRLIRRLFAGWWKRAAARYRLSSFMFGTRVHAEEGRVRKASWQRQCLRVIGVSKGHDKESRGWSFERDGGFVRVPARDTIPILRKHSMLVRVHEDGRPLTDADRELMYLQDTNKAVDPGWQPESEQDKRKKFRVVYIPPNFRLRLVLFIFELWLTMAVSFVSISSGAVFAGRRLHARIWPNRDAHDLECVMLLIPVLAPLLVLRHWSKPKLVSSSLRRYLAGVATIVSTMGVLTICTVILLRAHVWYPVAWVLGVAEPTLWASLRMIWLTEVLFALVILESCLFIFTLDERLPLHNRALALQRCRRAVNAGTTFRTNSAKDLGHAIIAMALLTSGPPVAAALINLCLGRRLMANVFLSCPAHLALHFAHFVLKKLVRLAVVWLQLVQDQIYLRGKQLRNVDEVDIPDSLPLDRAERPVIHVT